MRASTGSPRPFRNPALEALVLAVPAIGLGIAIALTIPRAADFGTFMDYTHRWATSSAAAAYGDPQNLLAPFSYLLFWPLSLAPLKVAFVVWTVAGSAACFLAWRLGSGRPVQLLLLLAGPASLVGWILGQIDFLIVGILVGAWWLARSGRPWLGGACLGLATVKPNLIFCLPLALLAAGRWRVVGGFVTVSLLHLVAGLAMLGPTVAWQLAQHWLTPSASLIALHMIPPQSILGGIFPGTAGRVLEAAAILLALAVAYLRRGSIDAVFAASLLGSLLATPYWHAQDLVLLLPVWWWLREAPAPGRWVFGVLASAAVLVYELTFFVGQAGPVLLLGLQGHLLNLVPLSFDVGLVVLAGGRRPGGPAARTRPQTPAAATPATT